VPVKLSHFLAPGQSPSSTAYGLLAHPSQFLHAIRHLPVASSLVCIINLRLTLRLLLWRQGPLAVNRAIALILQRCCPHGGGGGLDTSVRKILTPVLDCHKTVYRLVIINLQCRAGSYATLHNVIIGTAPRRITQVNR
jgi:hypothetical protein